MLHDEESAMDALSALTPVLPFIPSTPNGDLKDQEGAMVSELAVGDHNTLAAGLKERDLIVSVGPEPIETPDQLLKYVAGQKAGDLLSLGVIRKGIGSRLNLELGPFPTSVERLRTLRKMAGAYNKDEETEREFKKVTPSLGFLATAEKKKGEYRKGVGILELNASGGAVAAGILPNDVVLSVNKTPVNNLQDIKNIEQKLIVGSIARVEVLRKSYKGDTKVLNVEVGSESGCTLAEARLLRTEGGYPVAEHQLHTSTSAQDLLTSLSSRRSFGCDFVDQRGVGEGVLVIGVVKNGAAFQAGLRDNDRIMWVDGIDVDTAEAFYAATANSLPGDEISLGLESEEDSFTLEIGIRSPFYDVPAIRALRLQALLKISNQVVGNNNTTRAKPSKKGSSSSKR